MDDYTTAVEAGIARRRSGRQQAEEAMESLLAPGDDLEALAFWEHLAELASARVPTALAAAAEAGHEWSTVGAVLAMSATSAAQRHRRYQARRSAS